MFKFNNRGVFLAEVLISLLLVSLIVVSAFGIFNALKVKEFNREKRLRALYVGRSKLEELLSREFESLNAPWNECVSISDYLGEEGYLEGNVCVYIDAIYNWDVDPNVDAKQIEVRITFI